MADEDPMAYLNQKRAEMAAMSEMAVVAEQQMALAHNVASRMQQIESLLAEQPDDGAKPGGAPAGVDGDAEVEYWNRKIAELSGPSTSMASAPLSEARPALAPREFADENKAGRSNYYGSGGSDGGADRATMGKSYSSTPPSRAESKDSRGYGSSSSQGGRGLPSSSSSRHAAPTKYSSGDSLAPSAKMEVPLDGDAEVEYWRRKIAQLSMPVSNSTGGGGASAHSTVSPVGQGLGGGIGIGGGASVRRQPQPNLASQKLSWEGSQSYADENPDAKGVADANERGGAKGAK